MPATKGSLTRRHIIDQSLQPFTVKGYFNTSISDILKGFVRFSRLMQQWLEETQRQSPIGPGLDVGEVANFIVIALNGAAPLYAASQGPKIWEQTIRQLHRDIQHLRKDDRP